LKQCSTCSRTYADDTLVYCLDDGSMLVAGYDPQATLRVPAPRVTDMPGTQAAPASPAPFYQTPKRSNRWPIYVLVTLALVVVLGGVVTLLIFGYSRMSASSPNTNQDTEKQTALPPSQSRTPSPSQSPSSPPANSFVGVWRANVHEVNDDFEITYTFTADGRTRMFFKRSDGQTGSDYGTWQYSDGILFERFSNGASAKSSIRWMGDDHFELTIIDNGIPAYAGVKRRFSRVP
jgi:hypothetical protein